MTCKKSCCVDIPADVECLSASVSSVVLRISAKGTSGPASLKSNLGSGRSFRFHLFKTRGSYRIYPAIRWAIASPAIEVEFHPYRCMATRVPNCILVFVARWALLLVMNHTVHIVGRVLVEGKVRAFVAMVDGRAIGRVYCLEFGPCRGDR
jgi:hypothetical protein